MEYHNCKDLPLWAQILVGCASKAGEDDPPAPERGDESGLPDRELAA